MKAMTMESSGNQRSRISPSALMTLFIMLVLSLAALIYGISILETYPDIGYIVLLFSFLGAAIATYALVQMRRRLSKLKIVIPPVTTTIECKKCGFKNVREFQRGDYIFKEVEPCQKCTDKMLISAIYREVKEKEKDRFPF
jgi:hypothetical protein